MTAANADDQKVRLDKWLWAARFYKTRSLAKEAPPPPPKIVETGAKVTLRLGWQEKIVIVDDISDRRRGAPEAQKLYHETDDSVKRREDLAWQRKTMQAAQLPPARRPSKKDRRDIQRFREQNGL